MDAQLGIEPSPFASEATVLETVCAAIHHWAIKLVDPKGVEPSICLLAKQMPLPRSSHGPITRCYVLCFPKCWKINNVCCQHLKINKIWVLSVSFTSFTNEKDFNDRIQGVEPQVTGLSTCYLCNWRHKILPWFCRIAVVISLNGGASECCPRDSS